MKRKSHLAFSISTRNYKNNGLMFIIMFNFRKYEKNPIMYREKR